MNRPPWIILWLLLGLYALMGLVVLVTAWDLFAGLTLVGALLVALRPYAIWVRTAP